MKYFKKRLGPLENEEIAEFEHQKQSYDETKLGVRTPSKMSRLSKYKQKHNNSPKMKRYGSPRPKNDHPREDTTPPSEDTAQKRNESGKPIQDEAPPYFKMSQDDTIKDVLDVTASASAPAKGEQI